MQQSNNHPDTLTVYYEALNRLVAKGLKITLNAVAIEAARSPGSIKKKREIFAPLIREIQIRAKEQRDSAKPGALQVQQAKVKASKARADATDFEAKYKAALARELMLLIAWDEVTQELRKVAKVVPIKPPVRP